MALAAGTRLGVYEIGSQIGAGGMGEVYRAIDTNLKRAVAIKVLPDALAADVERLGRLQREAEVLASLNHPHIAQIYGLEKSDPSTGSGHAIVMEFVDGVTLADRIAQGPLPIEDAVAIAKQIAEALEAAHEQGIVHRDLKPANVKLRPDGQAKVLDFGLAKLAMGEAALSSPAALTASPTLIVHATFLGVILGTAGYMSPEQAKGKVVDRRADIWAFGVVLCEMLTGRRMYDGETAAETLARIIEREPDLSALPAATPATVRTVLERCLTKDPRARLQAIGEARILLERAIAPPRADERANVPASDEPRRTQTATAAWVFAGLLAVALAAAIVLWAPWRTTAAQPSLVRVNADIGADASLITDVGTAAVLSPDGRTLVFAARETPREPSHLFVRKLDQLTATRLAGTDDARGPFFSPDGQWVAFFAEGKLKRVPIAGGTAITIADAPAGRGGSWDKNGLIVFQPDISSAIGGLARVSSAGGKTEPLPRELMGRPRFPQLLPDGAGLLYTRFSPGGVADILVEAPGGQRKVLMRGGYARYLSSGHLVYLQNATLFAVGFDLHRLEAAGTPVPVLEGIMALDNMMGAQFAFSDTGTLVYLPGEGVAGDPPISWLTRDQATTLLPTTVNWSNPRFSPDGTQLAVDIIDTKLDIWTYDLMRGSLDRLAVGANVSAGDPVWTPDGRRIVFRSSEAVGGAIGNLYWRRADLTGDVQRLTTSPDTQYPGSWHPSGKYLAFYQNSEKTNPDIWILPMEGDEASGWKPGTPTVLLNTPANEREPMFSPDGHWLAYMSSETGIPEVFVRPFPESGGPWQISSGGGAFPVWSRTKPELFYSTLTEQIMVVSYHAEGTSFKKDQPRLWSETRLLRRPRRRGFDLHPDGTRFAAAIAPQTVTAVKQDKVVFVFNFFDELRRLAPVSAR